MSASVSTDQKPNVAEMVVIHRIFQREFVLMSQLIRQVPEGDVARAQVLAKYARQLLDGLHQHHAGEDELVWPKLLERATPERALIERMQAQHHAVADGVQRVNEQLAGWESSADKARGEELAASIDELRTHLLEHLDEEKQILPLVSQHLTKPEWDAIGEHARASTPKDQLPILFGAILEDATPQERALMLEPIPFPIKLLLRTLGARQYRRYVKEVRGVEPARR